MLDEEMICRIFDRFCVVCIRNEWISWLREQKRIADREINMESAATKYGDAGNRIINLHLSAAQVWRFFENSGFTEHK